MNKTGCHLTEKYFRQSTALALTIKLTTMIKYISKHRRDKSKVKMT